MRILCLDLEGVLIPEIWLGVAERTGIDALRLTTRDIADYDELMRHRLKTLDQHSIQLSQIQDVIRGMRPLDGAVEFLDWARRRYQVAIISDTFYEFATPLMGHLGQPLLLCHRLEIEEDRIAGYRLRQADPKRQCVRAFKSLSYQVDAAGDSYNDVSMLSEADRGFFLHAPANVRADYPQFPLAESYEALQALLGQ